MPTSSVVQRKLEIGSSHGAFELEADAMADRVVNMSDTKAIQYYPIRSIGTTKMCNL